MRHTRTFVVETDGTVCPDVRAALSDQEPDRVLRSNAVTAYRV